MRAYSHYKVDPTNPRAKAVCDRCGQHWQQLELMWQFQWVGPRLQNLRWFVCPPCLDKPQPNLKTFVYPPDPVPILNPRVEQYVLNNDGAIYASTGLTNASSLVQRSGGMSGIGVSPNFFTPSYGSRIGSLIGAAGLNAPFDGVRAKYSWQSATDLTSTINSSYGSYAGTNWQGETQPNLSFPSSLQSPIITHSLSSVTIYAPIDRSFLNLNPTTYVIQGSNVNTALYAAWTTIASGTTTGIAGEVIGITITSTMNNPQSQFHRVAFLGNGSDYASLAQATFSVNEVGGNGEN
jgi:hypothetical protein